MPTESVNVSAERFAQGMTLEQYLTYIGTPENLRREASEGGKRSDLSGRLRAFCAEARLHDYQAEAAKWLAGQPGGPAKVLVIAEEWSSDCRRDLPMVARLAEAADLELRIFTRDGEKFARTPTPDPATQPNADLVAQFLNEKRGQLWQSIPMVAFFAADMTHLYTYREYPAIYEKDRVVVQHIRGPRPGETPQQTQERADREFGALQQSPFWRIWACAAIDEMLSALHRRAVLGET